MNRQQLDYERALRANIDLSVQGDPRGPVRHKAIEDAIRAIQTDPDALRERYIGVKNYASFGDQREDHNYGSGPKHGSIVFRYDQ